MKTKQKTQRNTKTMQMLWNCTGGSGSTCGDIHHLHSKHQ